MLCVFARYGFWSLNRFVLHQLYFLNRRRRHFGRRSASSANDADAFTRVYGSAAPGSLPESTEWWRRQSRELFASVHGSSNEAIAHARPRAVREIQPIARITDEAEQTSSDQHRPSHTRTESYFFRDRATACALRSWWVWRARFHILFREAECKLMQAMVTVSHNDR